MRSEPATESRAGAPRVLHVAEPAIAGVPAYLEKLAGELESRGYQQVLVVSDLQERDFESLSCPVVRLPWRRTAASTLRVARRIRSLVAEHSIDIVHAHSSWAGLVTRLVPLGAPVVYQPHGWGWLSVESPTAARLAARSERLLSRRSAAVLVLSEVEAELADVAGLVRRVKPLVDLGGFEPLSAEERGRRRAELGWPEDATVVVCVGELSARKQQRDLVERFGYLARRDDLLVVVGDGVERDAIARAKPDNVQLVGWQSDVAKWIAPADSLVIPSRGEGFTLVIIEALACGVPIFTMPIGGAEAVGPDDGRVVESLDELVRAAASSSRSFGSADDRVERSARVRRRFEPSAGVDEIAAVYDEVLDAGSKRDRTRRPMALGMGLRTAGMVLLAMRTSVAKESSRT